MKKIAESAGVHCMYVGMLERAEKNVTIYDIELTAAALGDEGVWIVDWIKLFLDQE